MRFSPNKSKVKSSLTYLITMMTMSLFCMDNTELDLRILKCFDKDNDNVIDTEHYLGEIYHGKIKNKKMFLHIYTRMICHSNLKMDQFRKFRYLEPIEVPYQDCKSQIIQTEYDNLNTPGWCIRSV